MAIVKPFRGVRFNLEKVLLKQVIAPPYDVISPDEREVLVGRSSYNIVNIDLPEGEEKYQKAAQLYQTWRSEEILQKDTEPAIYLYEQEYEYGGRNYVRSGFVGLLRLEKLGEGVVFPHEKTLSGPKEDRLALMVACKANLSQIFGLYLDQDDVMKSIFMECRQTMPVESAVDDNKVKHTVWMINDPETIRQIQAFMKDKAVYIADGHHRYETSLTYRDKMREKNNDIEFEAQPYDYVMMMFVNFYDSGLMIFPTHRVLDFMEGVSEETVFEGLKAHYAITKLADKAESDAFLAAHKDPGTMVMVLKSGRYGLLLDPEHLESLHPVYREIDTYLLQTNIINSVLRIPDEQLLAKKGIHFYQSEADVEKQVQKHGGAGFILKPTTIEAMRKVSESGLVMPQKSTFFYPKLATGLILNEL